MNLSDYADWSAAYWHFNEALFGGRLPEVAFTLQRRANSRGYAGPEFFADRDGTKLHELAMNPDHFFNRNDADVLSTLVHEQCHIEQFCFGKPSRRGHHNQEWARMMEAVGLMPSSTGEPGGKKTGQKVTHYVIEGGAFDVAAAALLASGWRVKRGSRAGEEETKAKAKRDPSKVKFTCPVCSQNAWAKETAKLICGGCKQAMEAAEA